MARRTCKFVSDDRDNTTYYNVLEFLISGDEKERILISQQLKSPRQEQVHEVGVSLIPFDKSPSPSAAVERTFQIPKRQALPLLWFFSL